jgi:uncharacterized protein with HEPN domain
MKIAEPPSHDPRAYLYDMLENACKVRDYTQHLTFDEFWDSIATRDAVALRLAMIGEAAKGVDAKREKRLPKIPFDNIRGLRNRIVHDYGTINFRLVWKIAREDIEPLIEQLEAALGAD